MKTSRSACALAKYDICQHPADKERKSPLCEEHTDAWQRSPEWRAAIADESVRFAMALSPKMGMREVAKYRRKWMKRILSEAE